jgi:hypothetical protein
MKYKYRVLEVNESRANIIYYLAQYRPFSHIFSKWKRCGKRTYSAQDEATGACIAHCVSRGRRLEHDVEM